MLARRLRTSSRSRIRPSQWWWYWASAVLLATAPGRAAGSAPLIPLGQFLAEAEQGLAGQRPAEAAELLDRVLARVAAGESLPAGLALPRLQLVAAAAHFQASAFESAVTLAQAVLSGGAATFAEQAEAQLLAGLALARQQKWADARPLFRALEASPTHRDQARLYQAWVAQETGDAAAAAAAFETFLASARRDATWGEAALALVGLRVQEGDLLAASRGLDGLRDQLQWVDNLAGLEVLSLELGDAWLRAGDPEAALAAYDLVSPRAELLRRQAERTAVLERERARLAATSRGTPTAAEALRRLEQRLAAAAEAQAAIAAQDGYDAAVLFRRAQAFQRSDCPWEAALVLQRLLETHPEAEESAAARPGLVRAYLESGRLDRAEAVLDTMLQAPEPDETVLEAVAAVAAAAAAAGETDRQLAIVERALSALAGSAVEEPVRFLSLQALLAANRPESAREAADDYRQQYPSGRYIEEVEYLHAVAGLLGGATLAAIPELEAFLARYGGSRFEADARYRLAVARFGVEDHEVAARLCADWLGAYPLEHPQRGEVLALAGDVAVAQDEPEVAAQQYEAALALPLPDELLGYVLDEVTSLHERRGNVAAAARLWEKFAADHPGHPFMIHAAYWLVRLRSREGRLEEALVAVAGLARPSLDDPANDGVERLLSEVARLAVRAERPPGADGRGERWSELLFAETDEEGTAASTRAARRLLLEVELATARGDEARAAAVLDEIIAYPPASLSAGLLGRAGDRAFARADLAVAQTLYTELLRRYPQSLFADFGYVGLGGVALRSGQAAEALAHFEAAVDRAGARTKLQEATLGRARALLELGRWEEAREVFQQVAANRQWRGAATAESVFALGEILFRQGGAANLAQAQAHFQRVYLTYRKFDDWTIRAYLRSADTLERLEQPGAAAATLRELLRDPQLAARPVAAPAPARLAALESARASDGGAP